MCKVAEVRGQGMEETEECDWSTGSRKNWSGDACLSGFSDHAQSQVLDLLLGSQKLIEGFFIIKT